MDDIQGIGINVKKEKFEEFKNALENIAKQRNISSIIPILNIDAQII